MASLIAIKKNNKFSYIWEGEYGNVDMIGKILRKYYNTENDVWKLIERGDTSNILNKAETKIQSDFKVTDNFEQILKEKSSNVMFGYYFDTNDGNWYVYQGIQQKIEKRKLDEVFIEMFLKDI